MTGFWESLLEEREEREETARETLNAYTHEFCFVSEACPFDCIAITAPNPRASKAYLGELVHRVDGKGNKEVLILAVSDPEGVRIGSGGGTLNAILEIDEALRAAKAADKLDPQTGGLCNSRVLLVHSGGDSQRSPTQCVCGKAWSALNSCGDSNGTCNTPMDLLLDHLSRLFGSGLAPGSLVVTACDVMLLIPSDVAAMADWSTKDGAEVAGLAIAADAGKYAPNHGVYCLDDDLDHEESKYRIKGVREYLQKPSFEVAKASNAFLASSKNANPEVAIDSGVVVFSGNATSALIQLAFSGTFRGCTAKGVAAGTKPLRLELYSDLLLALKTGSSDAGEGGLEAYLTGCGPTLPPDHPLSVARKEIWNSLNGIPLGALLLRGATFVHLGTTPELMEMMTLQLPEFIDPFSLKTRAGSLIGAACSLENDHPAVVINSKLVGAGVVAGGAVIEHCLFEGDGWDVGAGSLVSGVRSLASDHRLRLRSGMCLQQTDLEDGAQGKGKGKAFVVSLFGVKDDIKAHYSKERARICGSTWEAFLAYSGATVEDIWEGIEESDRKLWSARLFPVLYQQSEGEDKDKAVDASAVTWMQHVYHCDSSSTLHASPTGVCETTKAWLAAERLSFKEILTRADPAAEFKWRRRLEKDILGGGRYRHWDAVAIVTPTMHSLREAQLALVSLPTSGVMHLPKAAFCVTPPDPSPSSMITGGKEWDGPLLMNAILVAVERFSALKKARFGSETSAAAIRGMRLLLCLAGETDIDGGVIGELWRKRVPESVISNEGENGGMFVRERDGSMFFLREDSIAPLLNLCQSDPRYQCVTYLGADNNAGPHSLPAEGSMTEAISGTLAYITAAAEAASTFPPKAIASSSDFINLDIPISDGRTVNGLRGFKVQHVFEMRELDERVTDEACSPAATAQALARVAHRMYEMADDLGGGGHYSGPGEHPDWQAAMRGLDTLCALPGEGGWGPPASLPRAVAELRRLRESWLCGEDSAPFLQPDPHILIRCARHYERAAAVVVSASVATSSQFIETPPAQWTSGTVTPSGAQGSVRSTTQQSTEVPSVTAGEEDDVNAIGGKVSGNLTGEIPAGSSFIGEQNVSGKQHLQREHLQPLPEGASVTSRAAVRIDLAGGWTDTPPISYEAGGAVLNVAVTLAGEKPVQACCDRIEECRVELVCEGRDGSVFSRTVCSSLEDFADFCIPQAPASLLKAVLICAGIVVLPPALLNSASGSKESPEIVMTLEEQLHRVFGKGGIRMTSRSLLPQGSGMGTSSILAGVVLSAACVAAGRAMSSTSLIHAVLRVEQLMTAGGGHQDQVGGIFGGVKICRTSASLPLQVLTETIPLDKPFEDALNDRLVLVFTGKQRLARDLLQGVVRGWHGRLPGTVNTIKRLVANAEEAANACRGAGDIETLGRCLSAYWEQKKLMAPGTEPPAVKMLMDKLRPVCHGLSVCGAGGGGFVACITKHPGDQGIKDVMEAATGSSKESSKELGVSVLRGRLDPVGMEVVIHLPDSK